MASQRLFVATLAGDAAGEAERVFAAWRKGLPADSLAVDRFCDELRVNAASLPVVYFNEWIDRWLMGNRVPGPGAIRGRRFEAACFSRDAARELAKHCSSQFEEEGWLAARLREAAAAGKGLADQAAIVVVREVFAGSATDEEMPAAFALTPSWLAAIPMIDYKTAFDRIVNDPRYLKNLDWGEARPGHPEGTVRAHIAEIEANLEALRAKLSEADYWKLKLLIHTHDSFKADAQRGVGITDPRSHASLAREFLAEFCADPDLLPMVQYHDEPYALWRQVESNGQCNPERFAALLGNIQDWNLFLAFNIIDGCTAGKGRAPLKWLFQELEGKVRASFTAADIL